MYRSRFSRYTVFMETQHTTPRKTKLLYVVESFSTGVYAIVRDIACNLDPEAFTVRILHSLRPDSPKTYEEDFAQLHISLQYIPMGSLKTYRRAVGAIREAIRTFEPDTIHLHSSKAGVLGRLAAKGSFSKRLLYSPHGFSFLRTDVGATKRRIFLTLEILADRYKRATIVAVSEGERIEALKITSDTMVINNFIDTSLFDTITEEPTNCVVTTGRIAPQKNPQLFNTIAKSLPDVPFLWVGDGPLSSELTASNITVTGYVPRSEAIHHVRNAKIYLQTSLWEGMPVSILEAMAAGKPIVASNIIGNRDLIEQGKTGILCDPQKPHEFAEALQSVQQSPELQTRLGNAARDHAHSYHDVSVAIDLYSREYTKSNDAADRRTTHRAR